MSEINELAKALAQAQAEIGGAKKDSSNPFFKSKYADLESVWEACRVALTKHGLSITQLVGSDERGLNLTTMLLHSSGQSVSTTCSVPVSKQNDPQAAGSAITYFRRYQLAAIVGVYQTDDDAELATDRKPLAPVNHTYLIPIGQHKGKPLDQVSLEDLDKIIEHLENNQTYGQTGKDLLFRAKQNRSTR
ncbi:MAG: ERF family protein [Candidatus Methylopumilus sp.]|nr:ERF family protein [Candidatus Methylopumilus sp.]